MKQHHPSVKLFVYTELTPALEQKLSSAFSGHETVLRSSKERDLRNEFESADIVLGNPPKSWFSNTSNLKFWQLDSAGFDQYSELSISAPVANMGDYFSPKCAETMMGGILAFYRNIHELVRLQEKSKWVGKPLRYEMDMLTGKKVIILGAGTIALCLRKMLSGFDCKVQLTARKNPNAEIHSRDELLKALSSTDLVVNTLPGKANRYADDSFFQAMREGSLYASVGRGNTTDEKSLIQALETGKLAGAVLDVTEAEPLPAENPLWSMTNVILTQHTGGGYKFEDEGKVDIFIENTRRFINGEKPQNLVDLTSGY